MKKIFIDTSAIIALFDRSDACHAKAKMVIKKVRKEKIKLYLTDYVFDESVTIALTHASHSVAVKVGEFILNSSIVELIWLDTSQKMRAWKFFKTHTDKHYSFTDCTSFVIMREKRISGYFAFDEDFSRAGFVNFHQ
jgi:predicted nucleic acid-binding protein